MIETPAPADDTLMKVLHRLSRCTVTAFEASVLQTCLRQRTWASRKQRRILARMLEHYVGNTALATELRGHLRLFEG